MIEHIHRLVLKIYPRAFRDRFGSELQFAFAAGWGKAKRRGAGAAMGFLATSVLDIVLNGLRERRSNRWYSPRARRDPLMTTIAQDFRIAVRMLRRRPLFSAVVITTLALGIAANTAIFSIVNGVLLKPLSYREPGQLAFVWTKLAWIGVPRAWISGRHAQLLQTESKTIEDFAILRAQATQLTGLGDPEQLRVGLATTNLFELLGVQPLLGRTFSPNEGHAGSDRVTVLTYGFWRERFGGDQGVLGRQITLGGTSREIIGVMPASFRFHVHSSLGDASEPNLWIPGIWNLDQPGPFMFALLARVRSGTSIESAQAELDVIGARLDREQYKNAGFGWQLTGVKGDLVKRIRPALLTLISAAGLVLLIACANVASLVLVRAAEREREMAVRTALGAGRRRIALQLLVESLTLSAAGAVLGLALATLGLRTFLSTPGFNVPRIYDVSLDGRVLAFTVFIAVLTGLLFGLAPAWQASRTKALAALRQGGRGSAGHFSNRLRAGLVVFEFALTVMLLVAATVLIRTFFSIRTADPGFDPGGVLTARISVAPGKFQQPAGLAAHFEQILDRVRVLPGVVAAGAANATPLSKATNQWDVVPDERTEQILIDAIQITPGYLQAMRIPLLQGRDFTSADRGDVAGVAIVDEVFARTAWPEGNPLGRKLRVGQQPDRVTVIGVVRQPHLYELHLEDRPQVFFPAAQVPINGMTLAVRADDPSRLVGAVRNAVWSIDPNQPLANVQMMTDVVSTSLAERRLTTILLTGFANAALLLATLGIYGVLAYAVSQRTREFGIRMALGAQLGQIRRKVVLDGLVLGGLGALLGLGGAFWLTRLIAGQLYGVTPTDPTAYLGMTAAVMLVALIASYLPARRATLVDPAMALRAD